MSYQETNGGTEAKGLVAASGWILGPDEVQRFSLPSPTGKTTHESAANRPSILLVEDNPADVGLVREALEEHAVHCELIVIHNGEHAIEFVESLDADRPGCPRLIILDLNLPRRSGRDVLKSVRGSAACAQVPVLILTSSDNRKDRLDAANLGASRYIRKPSRLAEFLALGEIFQEMLGADPS
jgi:CheY-like chemotaxis protein